MPIIHKKHIREQTYETITNHSHFFKQDKPLWHYKLANLPKALLLRSTFGFTITLWPSESDCLFASSRKIFYSGDTFSIPINLFLQTEN